jgi:hypothetical protein
MSTSSSLIEPSPDSATVTDSKATTPDNPDIVPEADQATGSSATSGKTTPANKATDVTPVTTQIITALNIWINALAGPQNPPFFLNAPFPDREWTHLFQLLAVATTFAGASALAGNISPTLFHPSVDSKSLSAITYFGCFAVLYSLYASAFGIVISIRQSLFCFGLITTPWFPIFILLKAAGWHLGLLWLVFFYVLVTHVLILIVRAIHIVSGAALFKVIGSIVVAAGLATVAVLTMSGYTEADSPATTIRLTPPPSTPAAPAPDPNREK